MLSPRTVIASSASRLSPSFSSQRTRFSALGRSTLASTTRRPTSRMRSVVRRTSTAVGAAAMRAALMTLFDDVLPGIVDRAVLPAARHAESTNDSALLAALIFDCDMEALADTITGIAADDPNARLNIVAGNGSRLLATTWGDTLSVLRRDNGVVLASEPYDDDPGWQEIPDRHLVEVENSRVHLTPLRGS